LKDDEFRRWQKRYFSPGGNYPRYLKDLGGLKTPKYAGSATTSCSGEKKLKKKTTKSGGLSKGSRPKERRKKRREEWV